MTNTKILSVFAIVAVAAMMGVSSIAPAYAAQKVVDDRTEFHSEFSFVGTTCGITSVFTVQQWSVDFIKIWSNDHYKIHSETVVIVTDDNDGDAVVLNIESVFNQQGNFSNNPQSIQYNEEGLCADGTTFSSVHVGSTLHRDGTQTDHHIGFF